MYDVVVSYVASDLYSDFIIETGQDSIKVTMDGLDSDARVPRKVKIGSLETLNDKVIRIVPSHDTQKSNTLLGLDGIEFLQKYRE